MGPGTRFVASAALASLALAGVTTLPSQASGAADVPTHHVRGSVAVEAGGYVEDVYLHLVDAEGDTVGDATVSGAGGTFDMDEVEEGGPYTLSMSAEPDYDWRRQYYPDTYVRSEAAPITVAGADVELEPMQLHLMHEVHGTVVADGHPVTWMRVTAYPAGPGVTTYSRGLSTTTDEEDGSYSLMLPPGVWKIRFDGVSNDFDNDRIERWAPEWHDDVSSFAEAEPVAVPAVAELGTTTLSRGGAIAGVVTDAASGLPIRKVDVQVIDADNRFRGTAVTRNDGSYSIGTLSSGAYKVKVEDRQAHAFATEYWDGAASNGAAVPVPVLADGTTRGIDVALDAVAPPDPSAVTLSGVVTDQDGVPVRGVAVSAQTTCSSAAAVAYTDQSGRYSFTGLTSPTYRVSFSDSYGGADDDSFDVMSRWYGGASSCGSSGPVPLGTLTADIQLSRYGGISGTLFDELGHAPPNGRIELYDSDDDEYPVASSGVGYDGTWAFGRLFPGTYTVFFNEDYWGGYIPEWWEAARTREQATEITVQPGVMASGIDGHLYSYVDCGEDFLDVVGTPTPGDTLSVAPGTRCAGRDLTYSYTWLLTSWQPFTQLQVGTGPSYTVQPDDWGYDVRVKLHVTGPDGTADAESAPVDVLMPPDPPPDPTVITAPTITGTPQVGEGLTASPGTWQAQQQLTFDYLWLRNGYSTGVTTATYVVRPDDLESAIEVRVDAARRLRHTWAFSAPVVIRPPGVIATPPATAPPATATQAILSVWTRVTGKGRGLEPGVRLLVRVPAGSVVGASTGGMLVVQERGRRVSAVAAKRGLNRLDLLDVRHGRHTYVVSFTGTVDGVVPDPVVVKVRVPRRR